MNMLYKNINGKAFLLMTAASLLVTPSIWAKKKKTAQKLQKEEKKLDITDLEKKYWAPKDTDFSVVQNRTYSKDKRFAVSLNYGKIINDTYTEGDVLAVSANYYFSERQGVEVNYMTDVGFKSSDVINAFQGSFTTNASPDHNRMTHYYGVSYNWVPIYAKMSLLGKKIVYFDMAFKPGVGLTNYEKQTQNDQFNEEDSALTYSLGVTQTVFLSKHISIKVDYVSYWYKEDLLRFGGSSKVNAGTRNNNSSYFTIGLQYFF